MASSIRTQRFPIRLRPALPRQAMSFFSRTAITAAWMRLRRHAAADPLRFAWQAATLPLWLASGIPSPDRPALRTSDLTIAYDLPAAAWLSREVNRIRRRFWYAGIIGGALRGATIGLIFTTVWAVLALADLAALPAIGWILAITTTGAIVGLIFGFFSGPTTDRVAAMLDRTLVLEQRLATAFDRSPAHGAGGPMRRLQLADAANVFAEVEPDIKGTAALTVREGIVFILAAIALVTVLLLSISSSGMPQDQHAVVPVFVPSAQRFAQEQQQAEAQKQAELAKIAPSTTSQSGSDQAASAIKDLNQLGNALATNSVTKDAANQIAQGDYAGAAQTLREASGQTAALPQDQRNALADQLDQAAAKMSPADSQLASETTQAAQSLRDGGSQNSDPLSGLADQVESSGSTATSGTNGVGQQGDAGSDGTPGALASKQSSSDQPAANNGNQQGQTAQQPQGKPQTSDGSTGTSDPGSGIAAAPGIGNETQPQADQSGASGDQKANAQSGAAGSQGSQAQTGQAPSSSGDTGKQSTGGSTTTQGSSATQGQGSQSSSSSQAQQSNAASNDSQSSTGSGASGQQSSQSDASAQQGASGSKDQQGKNSDTANKGEASQNPPPGGDDGDSGSETSGANQSPSQSLVLQGTSDDSNVPTGNDVGTSSTGSGSGTGAASGSATQGEVGPAGPDSNHVPDEYRDIVKGYFDGGGSGSDGGQSP